MDGKIRNNSNSANEELNNIDTTVNCFDMRLDTKAQ